MNWIDLIFIVIFILYVFEDSKRGFLRLLADLVSLVIAFLIALIAYPPVSNYLVNHYKLVQTSADSISFLGIWMILQAIFFGLSKLVSNNTPDSIKESRLNRYLAYIPALIKGVFFIIIMAIFILYLPFTDLQKRVIKESFVVGFTLHNTENFQMKLENIFTQAPLAGAGSVPSKNYEKDETIDLKFSTNTMTIDEEAEKFIFNKINEERKAVGIKPLVFDTLIRNVARSHSRDMLANGYFSHASLDGQVLFDRFVNANVNFAVGAENIALAPTADLVHIGLMNSPKHKKNILDPSFSRAGIGVMNAGKYGLMVTQDFAN
jgi:uncharacterized protein YkwD